jgi:pyruvate dehydrogenase E1 component beta subunit
MSWDKVPADLAKLRIEPKRPSAKKGRMLSYRQALQEALGLALKNDSRVFVYGEGVDDPSGVFGTTVGLQQEFGRARVFDTPICENTLTGLGIGAALAGMRPVLVHMRTDFLLVSMDQLVNHAAKWKYMFGGRLSVPLVVRAIIGGGWGSAAQHSQAFQAIFAHTPGLKVVMPATAYDAKGLLLASIFGSSPVIFIEHRWLYDHKDYVPPGPYTIPLGRAVIRKKGRDLTLIADSFMVSLALQAAGELGKEGRDIEVIDLRSIKPLDYALILASVKKTGRAVILDFGYAFCGISAEVSGFLAEKALRWLKAPLKRIALADVPTPASHILEQAYYPNLPKIIAGLKQCLDEQK